MIRHPFRRLAGLFLLAGLTTLPASAASFDIQGIEDIAALIGTPPPDLAVTFTVSAAGSSSSWTAGLEGNPAWAALNTASGTGGASLSIAFNSAGLSTGTYSSALVLTSGGTVSRKVFTLTVITPYVTGMVADPNRPLIYAISRDPSGGQPGHLIFLNTASAKAEKVLSVGNSPGGFDFSLADQAICVCAPAQPDGIIRIIDPVTRRQTRTLPAISGINAVKAGLKGRIIAQTDYGRHLINSQNGSILQSYGTDYPLWATDQQGPYLYSASWDYSGSGSSYGLKRFHVSDKEITTDPSADLPKTSPNSMPVVSGDGSTVFWASGVYDFNLRKIRALGGPVLASTYRGDIAFGSDKAWSTATGQAIASLPVASTVVTVSGDQQSLFQFNAASGRFVKTALSVIGPAAAITSSPVPADNSHVLLPLDRLRWTRAAGAVSYQVYFGTSAAAVAAATNTSAEYQGETSLRETAIPPPLSRGTDYYWRVDAVRPGTTDSPTGPVWKFTPSALSIAPNALSLKLPRSGAPVEMPLSITSAGAWTASVSLPWLSLSASSGNAGDPLKVIIDPAGLSGYSGAGSVDFKINGITASLPVSLELFDPVLTKMTADPSRPWIYALHPGNPGGQSYVLFINTATGRITDALPVGTGATDISINHQEGRLYVSNWGQPVIQAVDLDTRTVLTPIPSGTDIYKLSAGRAGRIYSEGFDQWVNAQILDSSTGSIITAITFAFRQGDGETDPSGTYYYHTDSNHSSARITKYDVSTDQWTTAATSGEYGYGSRNLVISPDGSRLFWQQQVYDSSLQVLGQLSGEIYATTRRGEIAVSDKDILNVANGARLASLPVSTKVSAVSGDQSAVFYFNPDTKTVGSLSMSSIAPGPDNTPQGVPSSGASELSPLSSLSWDVVPAALRYEIFFGTDATAVANATTASPEYAGSTTRNFWELTAASVPPGGTFYWRVDPVGLSATSKGTVWNFKTLAATVSPLSVAATAVQGSPSLQLRLPVTGLSGTTWSASVTGVSWLKILTPSGTTGGNLDLEFSPGSLPGGIHTASLTFQANGLSDTVPVTFTVEALRLVALKADPVRLRLYGLHRPENLNGSLLVFNSITGLIDKTIPISGKPTAMDLTPDNQFLYVITQTGRQMHRFQLDDWTRASKPLATVQDWDTSSTWYRVAAGAGDMVYWVDGQGAPQLHFLNFTSGQETSPPLLADREFGFGAISRNAEGTLLTASTQYGWSAGSSGAKPVTIEFTGAVPKVTVADFNLQRDPLDAPVIIRPGGSPVFLKKYKLGSDLRTVLKEYPAEIYAVSRQQGVVFGANAAWRESSLIQVWKAPSGIYAPVSALTGDESAFFYFDSTAAKLVKVVMSSLGDFPGPQPEDGEVVDSMPAALTWTPNAQALRYEVYFGRDGTGVQSATGSASPFHFATTSVPTATCSEPFRTAGVWWWRVDTILADGSTVKGPVWKFSGALEYLATFPGIPNTEDSVPSMAMEGAFLMVGQMGSQFSQYPQGSVKFYAKTPGREEWRNLQIIVPPDGETEGLGFGTSVALTGDTAWIAMPQSATGGKVLEYRLDGVTRKWSATGRKVSAAAADSTGGFGRAVAFDGSLLAVGIPYASDNSISNSGAVELFDAGSLVRKARFGEPSPTYSTHYGSALTIGEGFVAVGSPNRFSPVFSPIRGAVDIWSPRLSGTWERTTVVAPEGTSLAVSSFGTSVAASGDVIFAGAPSGSSGGPVFAFRKINDTVWTPLPPVVQGGPERRDVYASALAASGDFLAIGNPPPYSSWDPFVPGAWLHRRFAGETWTAVAPAIRPGTGVLRQMGRSLALTSRHLAVSHGASSDGGQGVTVYLHNPDGNLPPVITSTPSLFAEEGKLYQSALSAADENPDDALTFTAGTDLPPWLKLTDKGDGTAILSGTPPQGSAGSVPFIIAVTDSTRAAGNQRITLTILPAGGIPQITSFSADQAVNDGLQATFSVTVSGAPATYQWYQNGVLLNGETRSSLTIARTQASDAGDYSVRITRGGAWIDSAPMRLEVDQVADKIGGDWPTFGVSNSHTGAYPATLGLHKFLPGWTVPNAGLNQVATGQGRVYLTNGGFYAPTGNVFSAYDLLTGSMLWSIPLPSAASYNPPTYHRGRAYMQRGRGQDDDPELICVDAATGAVQWRSDFLSQSGKYFAPVVSDEGIFMNGGYFGGLYGFDLNGRQAFFKSLEQIDNWTPMLHDGYLYSWVAGIFRQYDPHLGQETRQLSLMPYYTGTGSIPAAEDGVAVLSGYSEIYAVSLPDMKQLWKQSGAFNGSPAISDGVIFIAGDGAVKSYNLQTGVPGKIYATNDAAGQPVTTVFQPLLLDDTLLVSSSDTIWIFDSSTGALLQRLAGGGPLTYTDGVLLAMGQDQTLRTWNVNQAPVITLSSPAVAATEDVAFTWNLTVADADGDLPVITTSGKPAWLVMGALTGNSISFSGTPRNADNGAFSFTLTADDQKSVPVMLRIEGFVTAVNDAPVGTAAPAPVTANEDSAIPPVKIADLFSDEEDGAAGLTVTIADNSNPSLLANAAISDGQLNLTAAPNAFGSTALRLLAVDSGGLTAETRVMVHLLPVNDPPAAVNFAATIAVDEDSPINPVPAGHLFGDIDNTEAELSLSLTGNSNPSLFASVTISRGVQLPVDQVNLVTAPNANGTAVLTITATDPGGLTATKEILVTVRPVNDPPVISGVIPDISAGGAATAATVNFAPFVKDPDGGDTLTWRVVSNSNPGLFSKLEFDDHGRLNIAYAPYLSGQATLTVEVTDAAGTKAQSIVTIDLPAIPDPSLTASATLTLNRQTGLWEQKVTIKNIGQRAIGGFEISITGLPAKATVYNASGGTDANPVVGYYQPIAAGESLTVMLEYYTPDRGTLKPQLTVTAVLPREATASAAGTIAVDRAIMLEPGAFLLEFAAIPGELYMIQYTDDAGTWRDSLVRLRAGGNRVQWIDRGAPRTSSPPGSGKSRFYRVKRLAAP